MHSIFGRDTLFIGFANNHPGGGFTDPMQTDSDLKLFAHANGNGADNGNGGNGQNGGNGRPANGNGGNGFNNGNGANGGNGQANGNGANGNGQNNGHHGDLRTPSVIGVSFN